MSRTGRLLPLIGFAVLLALLGFGVWWSQSHLPREVPSPLIGKPAPAFDLPRLDTPGRHLTKADMLGQPDLVNVFASWCFACGQEHPVLMAWSSRFGIPLIGYNYKDKPADAKAWLARHGNPYHMVIADRSGRTAIDFGVYGAPETYLIDARGIIRYKHIGPLTPEIIHDDLAPKIAALTTEAHS